MIRRPTRHAGLLLIALVNMVPAAEAEQSWAILAIALACAVASALTLRSDGSSRVAREYVLAGVVGSVLYLLYEVFIPREGPTVYVLDLAHFMILLCCCKFFEMPTHRDRGLVLIIAFLVLIIGSLVSGSQLFAAVVLFDLTFGAAWLIRFHLQREEDAVWARRTAAFARVGRAAPEPEPTATGRLALRETAVVSLGVAVFGAILFVSIPRGWGHNFFGGLRRDSASLTGLSDAVELTDAPIVESDAPVMRVRFTRGDKTLDDESFQPYMRVGTMSRYGRGFWQRPPVDRAASYNVGTLSHPEPIGPPRGPLAGGERIVQEVWLEHVETDVLPALYAPAAFGADKIEHVRCSARDLSLRVDEGLTGAAHYVVHSITAPKSERRGTDRLETEFGRDSPGEIPDRVADLARTITDRVGEPGRGGDPARVAEAMRDYLRGGNYQYTLARGRLRPNLDPIVDFLFEEKRGHCEYFASAMTLLCQSAGLQARLVTGFYGGQFNPVGGFFQFRKRDAHAWVEIRLPGRGWTPFDPSPVSTDRRRTDEGGLLDRLRRWSEFAQFKWATYVVAFDAEQRRVLVGRFEGWFRDLQQDARGRLSWWETIKSLFWGPDGLTMQQRVFYWLFLLLVLAFVLLLARILWILSIMAREYLPRRRRAGRHVVRRPEARFYDRLLLLLANKGHVKPAGQTPLQFARLLAAAHRDLRDLPEFTEWFYAAQYGREALDAERWARVKEFLARLREDPFFAV